MALDTIGNVGDTLFEVMFLGLGLVVTAIARIRSKVARRGVARGTRNRAFAAVIQRESMPESCALPTASLVALCAIRSELPLVHSRLSMARDARLRRVLEIIIRMATGTGHVDVRAGQLKRRPVVIKRRRFPRRCRVALRAIGTECTFVCVLATMAVHAVLRCALEITGRVAASAGHVDVRAGQLEGRLAVIEGGWLPGCGRVALRAVGAECALVCILAAMTVHTILWRILEIIAGVAASAGHVGMRTDQLERRLIVVERGWLPRRRRVTLRAVGAQCAVVRVLATVAVHTVLRCAVEHAVDVAQSAGHVDVRARQLERSAVVVKGHFFPIVGRVALRAIGAELAVVRIVLAVAIYTVLRGALEHAIDVASSAGHVDVRARQLERSAVVIEGHLFPIVGRVTLRAIGPELAGVRIVLAVAIYTVLRGALEHAVDVASSASHVDVRARQLERDSIVIKGGRLPALRRVTLRAVGAELAVVRVVLAVAIDALLRRALEELVGMTSGARCVRMLSHQLESGLAVIECRGFPLDRRMTLGAL